MKAGWQTRVLLLTGFGGLLLLLAALGTQAVSVLNAIQSRNDQIRDGYVRRDLILEQLRSDIFLSGTYVRDLLLEPDPGRADFHRAELKRARGESEALAARYNSILRPEERASLVTFDRELVSFFELLDPALAWTAEERHRLGYPFMQNLLLPRRMEVVHLTDQLRTVNETQLAESSRQVERLFADFRRRLITLLVITLSCGLALAVFSFARVAQLERARVRQLAETAQARRDLEDLSSRLVDVQESERKALSRELHDEVGQSLWALLLGIAHVAALLPSDVHKRVERELEKLQRLTERTVATVRDLSLLLRPSMLDDLGLLPALQWQAREVARTSLLDVAVSAEGSFDNLTEEQKTCVYRVVQEALRNTVRHAQATHIKVGLRETEGILALNISDDGRGFRPGEERGLGLLGMEERVKHLGGSFAVDASPGRGSMLSIEMPVSRDKSLPSRGEER